MTNQINMKSPEQFNPAQNTPSLSSNSWSLNSPDYSAPCSQFNVTCACMMEIMLTVQLTRECTYEKINYDLLQNMYLQEHKTKPKYCGRSLKIYNLNHLFHTEKEKLFHSEVT